MFKFIIRWTMRSIVILFVGVVALVIFVPDSVKTDEQIAIEKTIAKQKAQEEKQKAEAKRLANIEADRIYNLPENVEKRAKAQAINVAELTARKDCRTRIKSMALIPESVDFYDLLGTASRTFENFSADKHRIIIRRDGDWKNAFGVEIKFKGVCKYDFNPELNTIDLIEVLI